MSNLLAILIALAIGVMAALWQAYAMTMLWDWFIEPVFVVSSPSVLPMWGLLLFVSLPFARYRETNTKDMAGILTFAFVAPAVSILFGWLITFFI